MPVLSVFKLKITNKEKVLEACDNVLFFLSATFYTSKILIHKNVWNYIFFLVFLKACLIQLCIMICIIIRSEPYLIIWERTTKRHIRSNIIFLKTNILFDFNRMRRGSGVSSEIAEKQLFVPSHYLFQLVTATDNLIFKKKNLSGDFAQSLKPSSDSGRRKPVQSDAALGPSCAMGLETDCMLAVQGGFRLEARTVTQNSSVTLWKKPSALLSASILSTYCID